MTELEVEVWTARLTRIWTPESFFYGEDSLGNGLKVAPFEYRAQLSAEVSLVILGIDPDDELNKIFSMYHHEFSIHCSKDGPNRYSQPYLMTSRERHVPNTLTSPWLALYRRGCWLSGFPVEASIHEKMEWIQGFSREQLEAWKLKM